MPVVEWLAAAGFPGASLEERGDLLVIKLESQDRGRLLADPGLRDRLAAAARADGFARIALEIPAT